MMKKIFAAVLAISLVVGNINMTAFAAEPTYNKVADTSTAMNYENMLGTDADGNRYAGRIWADKSVYTDESVTLDGNTITNDSDFLIAYSALGSTTSVSRTITTQQQAPLDVVVVLDNSTSMGTTSYTEGTGFNRRNVSRLEIVTEAANGLLEDIVKDSKNRMAVVTYDNEARTLFPLNHYEKNGTTDFLTLSNMNNLAPGPEGVGKGITTSNAKNFTSRNTGGMRQGTNIQAGINMGMAILENVSHNEADERIPVVILLTDGAANRAVTNNWHAVQQSNVATNSWDTHEGVILSTLLNASYMKNVVKKNYNVAPKVYGISVDLEDDANAPLLMNPNMDANANAGRYTTARKVSDYFEDWKISQNAVTETISGSRWTFNQLPAGSTVTKQEVIDSINYVDISKDVSTSHGSADLTDLFKTIVDEITAAAFHPIEDTITSGGEITPVPLTYVDFIGDYMEIKDFKALTIFGNKYDVAFDTSTQEFNEETEELLKTSFYKVTGSNLTVIHPVFGTKVNLADEITIKIEETYKAEVDGSNYVKTSVSQQTLRVAVSENALPCIYYKVDDKDGSIMLTKQDEKPLRLYYTVGLLEEIIDISGAIDLSKISADYIEKNTVDGKVRFYSNRYGVMNELNSSAVNYGDAHISAQISSTNRYYYHQTNYPVYKKATNKNGTAIQWEEGEYGVLYSVNGNNIGESLYKLEELTYADVEIGAINDDSPVYTLASFHRKENGVAQDVTYLVYTTWGLLKEDIAGYDTVNKVYINSETETSESHGLAIGADEVGKYVATTAGVDAKDVQAYLGIGSWRMPRLNNMILVKNSEANKTDTAKYSYGPIYNEDVAHVGNLVVWLGNNGLITTEAKAGLQITKHVVGNEGNNTDLFEFEISTANTSKDGTYNAIKYATDGAEAQTTVAFSNGKAIVYLKDSESIYISELAGGVEYSVTEKDSKGYNVQSVTVDEKIENNGATATLRVGHTTKYEFTNVAKKYGNLIIAKEIIHSLGAEFDIPNGLTFGMKVTLKDADGTPIANKTFNTARAKGGVATAATAGTVTTNANGTLTESISLKNQEEIIIYGLEEGTVALVEETNPGTGFTPIYYVNGEEKATGAVTIRANQTELVDVENTYNPDYSEVGVNIQFGGTKTFAEWDGSNATLQGKTFVVRLERYNAGTKAWDILETKTVSEGKRSYNFNDKLSAEKYAKAGTYSYQVVEEHHGKTIDGITYDSTVHTFSVVVKDVDMNGTLQVVDVKSEHTGTSFVKDGNTWVQAGANFTNTYSATDASVAITIKKKIDNTVGSTLATAAGYEFGLYSGDTLVKKSDKTDAVGEAILTMDYKFNTLGENRYEYTLREIGAGKTVNGMHFTNKTYKVVVTVIDNGNGTTSATAVITDNGNPVETPTFVNTYRATGSVSLAAAKELKGSTRTLKENEFEFEVKLVGLQKPNESTITQKNEVVSSVKNAADGTVNLGTINYTEDGIYWYEVYEVKESLTGITYDETIHRVRVVVSDNGDGTLKTEYEVLDNIDDEIIFTNIFTPTPVKAQIKAKKELDGRATALAANEFLFRLREIDANGVAVSGGTTLYARNDAEGNVVFEELTFADVTEKYYQVQELTGNRSYITYDKNVYAFKVVVTGDNNGKLTSTVRLIDGTSENDVTFKNAYYASGALVIEGKKHLANKELKDVAAFEFQLYEVDANGTALTDSLPIIVQNDNNGNFSFALEYKDETFEAGKTKEYYYCVNEIKGNLDHITYDDAEYFVKVTLQDNGDGTLTATYSATLVGTTEEHYVLSFHNEYKVNNTNDGTEGGGPVQDPESEKETSSAPKTGDGSPIAVWSTLAFASIMVCGALLVIEKKRKNEI